MDEDLAIGRAINKKCPLGTGKYVKVNEVALAVVDDFASNGTTADRAVLAYARNRVRHFLRSQRDICIIDGRKQLVERFIHYPDGMRGDRWVRSFAMTRAQLGYKIAQLRSQQRGYDVRLRVYESIYGLLPEDGSIVGQVVMLAQEPLP
jgi:hypothetical protein